MSYTALYRKFRPLKFEDMVGEDHITKTLKNQIIAGRVGHAYLFNGGRGTGKTTAAKILARAVNCLNPKDGEPCNECEICKEILAGSLTDVVEMDAASNNSVDDIRAIRDEVNFLPTKAKYRVYIIDEVHMLTTGAFNALLKTLEEPPEHVKFILATTEPQKLPMTILSRCQRFDFKKITNSNIIKRLKIICKESEIKITDEALELIAVLAEGAMRDAISILERCCQENSDKIEVNVVKELVGIPKLENISKITESIFNGDEISALQVVDDVIDSGKDLNNFLWEIIKYMKDTLVYKACGSLKIYSKEEIEQIEKISKKVSKEKILKTIYLLSELENEIKWSTQRTIMFQTGIIKACMLEEQGVELETKKAILAKAAKETNTANAVKEVNAVKEANTAKDVKVEKEVKEVKTEKELKEAKDNVTEPKKETAKQIESIEKANKTKEESKTTTDINWKSILDALRKKGKMGLSTNLANTTVNQVGDLVLEIVFTDGITAFIKGIVEDSSNKKELTDTLFAETGKQWHIKYVDGKKAQSSTTSTPKPAGQTQINDLGIDINVIE